MDNFVDDDADGVDDRIEQSPSAALDSDSDGTQDYLDLDSDGDGIFDIVATGNADQNNDGILDAAADRDNDGILDSVDVDVTGGLDRDNDGVDDAFDSDFSSESDQDGDGIIDSADLDRDGDGRADTVAVSVPEPDLDAANGAVFTGLEGGAGCSLRPGTGQDPLVLLLLLLSLLVLLRGTRSEALRMRRAREGHTSLECSTE